SSRRRIGIDRGGDPDEQDDEAGAERRGDDRDSGDRQALTRLTEDELPQAGEDHAAQQRRNNGAGVRGRDIALNREDDRHPLPVARQDVVRAAYLLEARKPRPDSPQQRPNGRNERNVHDRRSEPQRTTQWPLVLTVRRRESQQQRAVRVTQKRVDGADGHTE